jgi:STE24 endopeptidase
LFFSFIFGLLAFWGLDYALSQKTIYSGLGLGDEYLGSLAVLLVAAALLIPCFTYWLSPLSNFFSRKHEFEADHFAADSMGDGGALINALTKLYQENLSHPIPHSLIVFFHYSHPPYFDRIRALKNFQK